MIIHTNDTHSQIDPDENNLGGILRRKVLIDSVRGAVRNVMLVDAGDAVQGTLYYHLFKGLFFILSYPLKISTKVEVLLMKN